MLAQIHFIKGETSGAGLEDEESKQGEADPETDSVVPGELQN